MKKSGKIICLSIIILSLLVVFGELLYLVVNLSLLKKVSYAWIDNNIIDFLLGAITIFAGLFVLGFLKSRKIRLLFWLVGLFCILGLGIKNFVPPQGSTQPIVELNKNKPILDRCLQSEKNADQCYLDSVGELTAQQNIEKQHLPTEFHRRWFEYAEAYCALKVHAAEYARCLYQETQKHLYWQQGLMSFVAAEEGETNSGNKRHFSADVFGQQLILAVLTAFLIAFAADRKFNFFAKLLVWLAVFVFTLFVAVVLIDYHRMYGLSIGNEFGYLAFDEFKHERCRNQNAAAQKECYEKILPAQAREIEDRNRRLGNKVQRKNYRLTVQNLEHFSNVWQEYKQSMCSLMAEVGKSELNYCLYKENLLYLRFLETLEKEIK